MKNNTIRSIAKFSLQKTIKEMHYKDKIKWRVRTLWIVLVCMLVYMVVVGELGGGDSRIMTPLAGNISRIIFFGGMAYVIYRIRYHKKLLQNRELLQEQKVRETDERNQYLHDKSGGVVVDVLLLALLAATCTAAMFNMAAFYMALAILVATIVLKLVAYWVCRRIS